MRMTATDAIRSIHRVAGKHLGPVAVNRIVIPHQHNRGRIIEAPHLAHKCKGTTQIHPPHQCALARLLDHRAIGHRVGERHADLNQIRTRRGEAGEQLGRGIGVGVTRSQIGDEAGSPFLPQ